MKKKIALSLIVTLSLSSPIVIAQANGEQGEYINPPVNPLPSMFDVSIDGDNDVPTIPPPTNPLPARDVFVQTTPSESSKTKTPTTPSNTQTARIKKPKKKTKTVTKKRGHKKKNYHKKGNAAASKKGSASNGRKSKKTTKNNSPKKKNKPQVTQKRGNNYPQNGYRYEYKTDRYGNITSSTRINW